MMEMSENVSYMKLLHELKGAFPNMPDDLIHQCIKQHGIDKLACCGALRILEAQQLSMTHNHSYAPARMQNHQYQDSNYSRRLSWQGKLSYSHILQQQRRSQIVEQDQDKTSTILPMGIAYKKKTIQPKVVLTPESPYSKISKTLYDPNGNSDDHQLSMFGTASAGTATCVDIDMESLSSSSSNSSSSSTASSSSSSSGGSLEEPVCSVARATWCSGNFRYLDEKGQSVATTAFTSMTVSSALSTTTTSTLSRPAQASSCSVGAAGPPITNIVLTDSIAEQKLLQNPYRKIFEQRQQFYEKFSQTGSLWTMSGSETSSIKSSWQRNQRRNQRDVFTVKTNIEPFGPFVIEHDVKSSGPARLLRDSNMICLNPDDQDELRYATSHSGDGVESHLEVSLGKDGSIIKTRRQRLGGTSEENSILKLQYGQGGKVLEIKQMAVPLRNVQNTNHHHRPTSAYCTSGSSLGQQFLVPRYNSMPNLDHGNQLQRRRLTSSELGFNIHPADEEKRMAYTMALIGHQLDQRQKLERRLHVSKNELQTLTRNVHSLKVLLDARSSFIQNGGVVDVEVTNELEQDVLRLQHHCDDMASQVTQLTQGSVPLGDTSVDFYESLPSVLNRSLSEQNPSKRGIKSINESKSMPSTPCEKNSTTSSSRVTATATGLLAKAFKMRTSSSTSAVLNNTNLQWSCTKCTFLNHPALKMCEECEMPRFPVASEPSQQNQDALSNNCLCHDD